MPTMLKATLNHVGDAVVLVFSFSPVLTSSASSGLVYWYDICWLCPG